jgi:hypothetical protein
MFRLILVIIFIILTSYRLRAGDIEIKNIDIKSLKYELIQYIPGNIDSGVKCWTLNEKKQFQEAFGISIFECRKLQKQGAVKFYEVSQFTKNYE